MWGPITYRNLRILHTFPCDENNGSDAKLRAVTVLDVDLVVGQVHNVDV